LSFLRAMTVLISRIVAQLQLLERTVSFTRSPHSTGTTAGPTGDAPALGRRDLLLLAIGRLRQVHSFHAPPQSSDHGCARPLDAVFQLHTELWRKEAAHQLSYPFYSPSQRPERGA